MMHAHWHRTQDMQYAPRVLHFSAFHYIRALVWFTCEEMEYNYGHLRHPNLLIIRNMLLEIVFLVENIVGKYCASLSLQGQTSFDGI